MTIYRHCFYRFNVQNIGTPVEEEQGKTISSFGCAEFLVEPGKKMTGKNFGRAKRFAFLCPSKN